MTRRDMLAVVGLAPALLGVASATDRRRPHRHEHPCLLVSCALCGGPVGEFRVANEWERQHGTCSSCGALTEFRARRLAADKAELDWIMAGQFRPQEKPDDAT